jgi:L,D-transpeptidase YcbB
MRRVGHWLVGVFCLFITTLILGWGPPEIRFRHVHSIPAIPANGDRLISPDGKTLLAVYLNAGELPDLQYPDFSNFRSDAKEFYESAGNTLPWLKNQQASNQALAVIQVLQRAENEGLNSVDYDGSRWAGRLAIVQAGHAPEADLIRFDLALTVCTMRYLSDLHRGRVNPRQFHFDLDVDKDQLDLPEFLLQRLVDASDVSAVMRSVEPPFPAYGRTVNALETYTKLASEYDGEPLPAPSKPVKPGDDYNGIPRLTRLLSLLGDLPAGQATPSDLCYSGSLVVALKHFQQRHGLEPNGILDARTFRELNTPLSQRVLQLKLTLERWRWLPHEFEQPPIVVNIPEFRVYAANDEYFSALSMKVVVGRSYKHQTPVFATQLKSVIFRPYWNVPLDIVRNELLPELKKDPDYLRKHDYEVVGANEAVVSDGNVSEQMMKQLYSGRLAIRQRPGETNALGLIKFDMPNIYDVYMHGTPATELFLRSRRDFSHGCIRVEDPVSLAEWVLRDRPEWDRAHIVSAMYGTETFHVSLAKPIPVLILYGTAITTESGEIHFFDDIYGHDAVLEQALAKGYPYQSGE